MNEKNAEKDTLEIERLKLERLKIYGKMITVLISVIFGTFGVALINYTIQKRQIEQQQLKNEAQLQLQEKKAEADRRQAEMKYLGDYLSYALEDSIDKRLRFAGYFSALTISPDLQAKWKNYYKNLESSLNESFKLEEELKLAERSKDPKLIAKLSRQVAAIQRQLSALTELSPFPNENFLIIVPFSVGGKSDKIARVLAQALKLSFRQDVLVFNFPGQNELVGWKRAASAKADGYTLTVFNNKLPIKSGDSVSLEDFEPIGIIAKGYGLLAPKGTADEIIRKLENATKEAVNTSFYKEKLTELGFISYFAGSHDFYTEIKNWYRK
jgi:hypothetical protein